MIINHKVSFVFAGLTLLMSLSVLSQNAKIDSLKEVVASGTKDTVMVIVLNDLSSEMLGAGDIDESLVYAEQALDLSSRLKYLKGKAYSLKQIGMANYYKGNYLDVFDNWTQSLENFEMIKDSLGISNMLNNLGTVYYSQGSNVKAIDYYLRSLRIAEKLKHPFRISTALVNVASVYGDSPQDWDKALNYYEQALPYLNTLNDVGISKSYYFGIGEIEYDKKNYQAALKYFEEGFKVTKNTLFYSENLLLVGKTKFKLGQVEEAISLLNQAYSYAVAEDQSLNMVKSLIELGIVYQNSDFKKAISSYQEAERLAIELDLNYELADIYDGISKTYINQGNYFKGYQYQTKLLSQKDSLFNIDTNDKMRGLQFDFDLEKKEDEIGLLEKEAQIQELTKKRQKNVIWVTGIFLFLLALLAVSLFRRYKFTQETNLIIESEKNRSESLLLNILPDETANELKVFGKVQAKRFESVTVMFTDFVGFTAYAKNLEPEELVSSVDYYFSKFDGIMEKYGVEKIKTIGDAYMCASGLPHPKKYDVFRAIQAAFEIIKFIEESKSTYVDHMAHFDIRIGMNTGPIVAGVVGTKKFAYDIWGDSVNVASRMETKSLPGKINVSETTYNLIKDVYDCEYRGEIDVKNKGMMKMYFVNGIKDYGFVRQMEYDIAHPGDPVTVQPSAYAEIS